MDETKYQQFLEKYKVSLPEKLETLKNLVANLQKIYNKEDLTALRFLVHKVAGNASLFGFPELSKVCHTWDIKLSDALQAFPNALSYDLQELIDQFEKAVH